MDSFATVLRDVTRRLPPFPELDFRDPDYIERFLLDLPDTDTLQARVEAAQAAVAEAAEQERPLLVERRRSDLRHAERQFERGQQRDTLQAERPDGCWCLGLGGKDRVGVPLYAVSERSGLPLNEGSTGWATYCGCPEGERMQAERGRYLAAIEQAKIQKRLEQLFGGLPEHFRGLTLDTYPWSAVTPRDLETRLRAWPASGRWLFLHGPVGLGKTALAIALLRAEIEAGHTGLYRTVGRLLDLIKDTYSDRSEATADEQQILTALYGCDVLVLDDLGKEMVSGWVRSVIFKIVDARYAESKRTLVTSNNSLGELALHLGDPAALDRIREMAGMDYQIEMGGASLRGRRAA